MEEDKFYVMTENQDYFCGSGYDLKRVIKALKYLNINYTIYYKLKNEYVKSVTDLEAYLDNLNR